MADATVESEEFAGTGPTNADIMREFKSHKEAFQESLQAHADEDKRNIQEIRDQIGGFATKNEVKEIFEDSLKTFFKVSGLNTKTFIVGLAVIIGSLTVILTGFKAILAWVALGLLPK